MRVVGGPWDGQDVPLRSGQVGFVLHDRPADMCWIYDLVQTPDGPQLDVRESEGRMNEDEKRFATADDPTWAVRVVDAGDPEEVGR